jgi:DNA mismatch endonuclease (patch repair protein)
MAAIRSRGNMTTEKALRFRLVRAGISGWRLHLTTVPGKPDFVFAGKHLAIFVDGCYWHGCPKCYRSPTSNTKYWSEKFMRNKSRDRSVTISLRRSGWKVVRIWEHEVKRSPVSALNKIRRILGAPLP